MLHICLAILGLTKLLEEAASGPSGAWIPPPQSGSTVQQRARHQSIIKDLVVLGHRIPRFGGRWRPEAAAEAATARGWGVADRARANPVRF